MIRSIEHPEFRIPNRAARWLGLLALLSSGLAALAADLASLCADRAAIERIYYRHRLGDKPPFEQALPRVALENLVGQDLRKEAALKQAYGVEVTPAMLEAEVQRINTATRAPEILAEIKTALGHDPARFARAMAKPILVERLLRKKFDHDDHLQAPQRREAERLRSRLICAAAAFRSSRGDEASTSNGQRGSRNAEPEGSSLRSSIATNDVVAKLLALLKQSHSSEVSETTWQLGARPAETNASTADELEIKKRFGQNAQILSSPHAPGDNEEKCFFEDLPDDLQVVLRLQLRQPGDVSAVIEMPGGFLLYVAKENTDAVLSVAGLSWPKLSYQQWLEEQNQGTN